jgi:hypothetical protein
VGFSHFFALDFLRFSGACAIPTLGTTPQKELGMLRITEKITTWSCFLFVSGFAIIVIILRFFKVFCQSLIFKISRKVCA